MKTSPLTRPCKAELPAVAAATLRAAIPLCLGLVLATARAQVGSGLAVADVVSPRNIPTYFSVSRQFIVHGIPASQAYFASPVSVTNTNLVRLESPFLAMSCERVKHALLDELGLNDQWRGNIFLELHRAMRPNEPIVINSAPGGNYRVDLPDAFDQQRLVPAIVEVILLELVNRNAGHYVEIPPWLALGLAAEVTFNSEVNSQMDLVVSSPGHHDLISQVPGAWAGLRVANKARSAQRSDLIKSYRQEMPNFPPLTLRQLTWPEPAQFEGEAGETYRDSAQMFVHELLALKDGPQLFRAFLAGMPEHWNWQIALFEAFHSQFANQRELEKWWALRVVKTTGRELDQTWPAEESWRKLDEVLQTPVEIRTDKAELPMRAQLNLLALFDRLDHQQRTGVIQQKIRALDWLSLRVSPDVVLLLDEYRRTFETYLREKDEASRTSMGRAMARPGLDGIDRDTMRELDRLDRKRGELRANPTSPGTETASAEKAP